MEKSLIEAFNWRYATKIFDKNKKVSDSDLDEITEAFRLSPSWYWLQPWKLIIVENKKTREELLPNSWNQAQIVDASHLIVLARVENPGNSLVDSYLDDMVFKTWASREDLKWYEDMMKWFLNSISLEARNAWADRQVMIAAWFLISFLASKEIDSCPIEWFDKVKYNEILWLEKLWLSSALVLPIWYRSSEDKYAQRPKIRFAKEKLIMKI